MEGAEDVEEEVVVLVGGSGYLGLHLLQVLASHRRLAFTYFSHPPPPTLLPHARRFHVDLRSGEGFHAISLQMGPPRVVINCAAISIPRECESDPSSATAINVPHALLNWLSSLAGTDPPLLIHLSTDQVYEGTKSFYKEEDETKPVNAYGRSKLEAEQVIMKSWPNYAILRSSIIYGPEPVVQVQKSLPVQWIEGVLSSGKGAEFFHDEFRCPVFVMDVVKVVELLLQKQKEGASLGNGTGTGKDLSLGSHEKSRCVNHMGASIADVASKNPNFQSRQTQEARFQLLLNVGGPQRLSRAEMAEVVADVRGFDKTLVTTISAASVNRGVASPADISMNVSRCISTLNIALTPFRKGVELTLTNSP